MIKKWQNRRLMTLALFLALLIYGSAHMLTAEAAAPQSLRIDGNVASMTEKRTFEVKLRLPHGVSSEDIGWTYGGKPLSEWKKYKDRSYSGDPYITVHDVSTVDDELSASVTFESPYDTDNLAESQLQVPLYASLMGTYELSAVADGKVIARTPVKLTPYDSFVRYEELMPAIDAISKRAVRRNGRYMETMSIGKSVEGRDIYFTVLAKDREAVDKYRNVTHPAMMNDPEKLKADIETGAFDSYQVPVWLNNIHPNETPGVSAILNLFETMALKDTLPYETRLPDGNMGTVTMDIDDILENVIFLFAYTNNPDGLAHTERVNANWFDLNRDNSYQTQPETQSVTAQIARWSPVSFLDMHGFDANFLIEPATPPHDPNLEYDLLIGSMLEQAAAMGEAGTANTKFDYYHIPYEEHRKSAEDPKYTSKGTSSGWDDASPAYTAVFAMHHGAMGHTLEVPEFNEESVKALYYAAAGAASYVADHKERLFLNQLSLYARGMGNVDDRAVDRYLVNADNEAIGRPRQGNENFFPEYYVLPVDESLQRNALEAYRMVQYLLRNGVKVGQTTTAVTVAGTVYPPGSYVIDMHQSLRGMANLVLYDGIDASDFEWVAGEIVQNFADLRGFDRYEVREEGAFDGRSEPVASVSIPATQMPEKVPATGDFVRIRNTNNDAIRAVNELLATGKRVTMLTGSGVSYTAGDFAVSYADIQPLSSRYYLDLAPFSDGNPGGKMLERSSVAALGQYGLALEQLGFEVTDDEAAADVLVNTFESEAYVKQGKPYIAFGRMGMSNVQEWIPGFAYNGPEWEPYEGVFKVHMKKGHPITGPYDLEEYFYTVSGSYVTSLPDKADILATAGTGDDFFKAGWWPGHDAAQGKVIGFTYRDKRLNLTVFANDLIHNGHSQHQYRLLANAVFNAR